MYGMCCKKILELGVQLRPQLLQIALLLRFVRHEKERGQIDAALAGQPLLLLATLCAPRTPSLEGRSYTFVQGFHILCLGRYLAPQLELLEVGPGFLHLREQLETFKRIVHLQHNGASAGSGSLELHNLCLPFLTQVIEQFSQSLHLSGSTFVRQTTSDRNRFIQLAEFSELHLPGITQLLCILFERSSAVQIIIQFDPFRQALPHLSRPFAFLDEFRGDPRTRYCTPPRRR